MARITIDPITRVGGQLRVEAEISGGRVSEAWTSATMFRGIEAVLGGRDPRDAWLLAQRICGTCTGSHAVRPCVPWSRHWASRSPPTPA